jgi:hypothetical protein
MAKRHLEMLGLFVRAWAVTETSLDLMIDLMIRPSGDGSVAVVHPRAMKDKVQLARRCFKRLSSLAPLAQEGLQLLDRITKLSPIDMT